MELKAPDIQLLLVVGLVVPDWNPRKTMSESGLAALKAYVEAGGTIDRIWVWGGDGKSIIAGQRRLTVYRRLGKTHIEAEILHISLEEAKRLARASNRGEAVNWLEEYEGWENYFAPGSKLTDEEIGALEGADSTWIRRARALLAVLNPAARRLIRKKLLEDLSKNKGNNDTSEALRNVKKPLKKRTTKNEEKRGLLEDVAFPLTRLWDKRTIQEAQALVEKSLPVILSREMSGPQVKALVKWVSDGKAPEAFGQASNQNPEEFGPSPRPSTPSGEKASSGTEVATSETAPIGASKGERPNQQPEVATSPNAPIGAAPRNDSKNYDVVKEPDLHSQVATAIASHELGKKLHIPTHLLNRLFPPLTRLFHRARGLFTRVGIKNPTLATFLTFLLFLFLGSFLYSLTARLMNSLWNGFAYSHLSPDPQVGRQDMVAPNRSADGNGGTQGGSVHLSPGPQAGRQALAVPSQGAEGNGGTKAGSANGPPSPAGGQPQGSAGSKEEPTEAVSAQTGRQVSMGSVALGRDSGQGVALPNQGVSTPNSGKAAPSANPTQVTKGLDPLKAIGDGVKDYQSAVNTAGDAKSATDKAKSLLPF